MMSGEIEKLAQTKPVIGAGIAGVTASGWVEWVLNDPTFQAVIILTGFVLSLTIIIVNLHTIVSRIKSFFRKRKP